MSDFTEKKSRTQKKNEVTQLQKIGEKLISLTDNQLSCINIPEELIEAIIHAKTIKSNQAKRRQKQYIGALMRTTDIEAVQKALRQIEDGLILKDKKTSQIKLWHDTLIKGDDSPVEKILSEFPETDRQRIRQLIRNARKEKKAAKSQKAAKNLLNYLKEIVR